MRLDRTFILHLKHNSNRNRHNNNQLGIRAQLFTEFAQQVRAGRWNVLNKNRTSHMNMTVLNCAPLQTSQQEKI
jgi:hypothetical protein